MKIVTNYGEILRPRMTIYLVEFHRQPMDLRLRELHISKLEDRRIKSHKKDDAFWYEKWNDIGVTSDKTTILSLAAFGNTMEINTRIPKGKDLYDYKYPNYFYEKGIRVFYTNKEEAIEAFKKKYRNNFLNKNLIPKIFQGTGNKYYPGHGFVGYKYFQYHLPK
jgi:hypothetical protein